MKLLGVHETARGHGGSNPVNPSPPPPGGLRGGALVLSDLGAGESVGAAEALGRGNAQTDDRVALFKVTSKLRVSIPALF